MSRAAGNVNAIQNTEPTTNDKTHRDKSFVNWIYFGLNLMNGGADKTVQAIKQMATHSTAYLYRPRNIKSRITIAVITARKITPHD